MSYNKRPLAHDERASKSHRSDSAADASSHRYADRGQPQQQQQWDQRDRYARPPQNAPYHGSAARGGGGHPSAQQQQQPRAHTSGFIHPDRMNPSAAHRPAAYTAPHSSSSSSSFPSSHASASKPAVASSTSAAAAAAAAVASREQERLAEAEFQRRMEAKMTEMSEEKTEDELAAERAAKRAAILAKYKLKEEAPPAATLSEAEKQKILEQAGAAPAEEETSNAGTAEPTVAIAAASAATAVPAPAPIDPTAVAAAAVSTDAAASSAPAPPTPSSARVVSIDSYDMFSDSALAPEVEAGIDGQRDLHASGAGEMMDSYDDHEGYYRYRLGDLLEGGRYRVTGLQGSGVFSTVLRVRELVPGQSGAPSTEGRELVVKLIRANDTMFAAGQKELEYLRILSAADPENRKHTVRLLAHFMHRNHLCLVFEPLNMDLRKVIKKFGSVGLNLRAVRSYAKQLMIALRHLKKCQILHGDIKPDNSQANHNTHQRRRAPGAPA